MEMRVFVGDIVMACVGVQAGGVQAEGRQVACLVSNIRSGGGAILRHSYGEGKLT